MEREVCYRCMRPHVACLCAFIKPTITRTKFVFLIHPKELRKEKANTGRLTKLTLTNSEMFDGVCFDDHAKLQALLNHDDYYPVILYPGEKSLNLSENQYPQTQKNLLVIILDATWPLAKKMMRESLTLQNLPRISFSASIKSEYLIKEQPHPDCLSTLESVHEVLSELTRLNKDYFPNDNRLKELFYKMRDYQIECAMDPNKQGYRRGNYKLPTERKPSLKKRRIFFL